jgi:hypothetical protein
MPREKRMISCRQIIARRAQNLSACALSLFAFTGCEFQASPFPQEIRTADCIVEGLRSIPGVEPQGQAAIVQTMDGLEVGYSIRTQVGNHRFGKSAALHGVGGEPKEVVFYLYDDATDVYDMPLTEVFNQKLEANCGVRVRFIRRSVDAVGELGQGEP